MKRLLSTLLLSIVCLVAVADDKPIDVKQLPQKATAFMHKYYPKAEVMFATLDKEVGSSEYKVHFENGTKLEFDRSGEWKSVDCKKGDIVPREIVDPRVLEVVDSRFKGVPIMKIERERDGWELKLQNGVELEFNKTGNLIGMDR